MKTSQMVLALAVLMVMVFALTVAMNFIGGEASPPAKIADVVETPAAPRVDKETPQLVFESTDWPGPQPIGIIWELKRPGHHDFWFTNPNPTEVSLGLKSKSCKCTDAELFLSNSQWDAYRQRVDQVRPLGNVLGAMATVYPVQQEAFMHSQESQLVRHGMNDRADAGFPVPPGSSGWIRLSWTADRKIRDPEKDQFQQLKAELWMHHKDSGLVQALNVKLMLFPVLRVMNSKRTAAKLFPPKMPSQMDFGTMSPRDLPRTAFVLVASATRAQIPLKTDKFEMKGASKDDPFVVGPAIPLTREEAESLAMEMSVPAERAVMCAYAVPITLMDKVGDRYCDTGMFYRVVRLTATDGDMEPLELPVAGIVEGDVEIGSHEDRGRLTFGNFNSKFEIERHITLLTETEDLNLELDSSRLSDFLKATLKKNQEPAGAVRHSWRLTVSIPPGRVSGIFPRDEPLYRDSAVYVKAGGARSRLIRIPVEGNAENR